MTSWHRPSAWLAMALLLFALCMIAFMSTLAILPGHERLSGGVDGVTDLIVIFPTLAAFVALPAVGALLALVRSRNPVGWILLVGGVTLIMGDFTLAYVERSVVVGPELPGYRVVDWLAPAFAWLAIPLLCVWLPLLFPDGRLPGRNWRIVGVLAAVNTAIGVAVTFVATPDGAYGRRLPNPTAWGGGAMNVVADLSTDVLGGLLIAAVVAVALRFRRSQGEMRQQMKWFVAAIALLATSFLLLAVATTAGTWALLMAALALIPIAIGIAILRYRLYDIDRIISRTLGYAIVTIILGATFAGLVLGLQALARPLVGSSQVAVAVSTLTVAALFGPLRVRVQAFVDRRFYRSRYDATLVAAGFGLRLRDRFDLEAVRGELMRTANGSLNPDTVSVWVRTRPRGDAR